MDELDIKAAVLTRIRRQARGRPLPVVTSEFSLNGTGIRADLAVLDSGVFYGVEIKSGSDTLKRLPSQMEGYARYFDRTELAVAPKHLHGLQNIGLHGAEVWRVEVLGDWQRYRRGVEQRISGQWLFHLLTADEERRATRTVEQRFAESADADRDQLRREEFQRAFEKRYAKTSISFWETVKNRRISAEDLKLLSRFHAHRQEQKELAEQSVNSWELWISAMKSISG